MDDARYLADLADKADDFKHVRGPLQVDAQGEEPRRHRHHPADRRLRRDRTQRHRQPLRRPRAHRRREDVPRIHQRQGHQPEKDKDGSYKVDVPNSPFGAAYLPLRQQVRLRHDGRQGQHRAGDPARAVEGVAGQVHRRGVRDVDIDKIPDELKKVAIGQTANGLAELAELKENEGSQP